MKISSNNDLYIEIRKISAELQQIGFEEASRSLSDAMTISCMPGEILGEIRLQLLNLLKFETSLDLKQRERINEAVLYINNVL